MFRRCVVRAAALSREPLFRQVGCCGIAFLETGNVGVVEHFGKYSHQVQPGLNFYVPFFQKVKAVSTRTILRSFIFETKTSDNIFTTLTVAARCRIIPEEANVALYKLDDPELQIRSFLDSEIRAQVSKRELDTLYSEQEEIGQCVFKSRRDPKTGEVVAPSVASRLRDCGFQLEEVLIRQIEPDSKVKAAMNEINASLRNREAAKNQADAEYILEVRKAEADRDRMRLQGEGVSQQRTAILKGYEDGVGAMTARTGLTPKQVIDFILKTQHLDTLQSIAKSPNAKTIFTDHKPNLTIEDSVNLGSLYAAEASARGSAPAVPTASK